MPGPIIATVMEYAHKEVYGPEGKWKSGDWFVRPAGIQVVGGELYPSWWNKSQGQTNAKLTFDQLTKLKATDCTPAGAKIELDVIKMVDPVTKKDIYTAPDGYDANKDDNQHKCGDVPPTATVSATHATGHNYKIIVTPIQGTFGLTSVEIKAGNTVINSAAITTSTPYIYDYAVPEGTSDQTITATITDAGYYTGTSAPSTPISYSN